jgi:hypothetical protein
MSPRRFSRTVIAALLGSLALSAPAFAHGDHVPAPSPESEAAAQAAERLGPASDRHLNVESLRDLRPIRHRPRAATQRPGSFAAGKQIDLKLLVLSADGHEPTFAWWKQALRDSGVPYDTLVATQAADITAATLRAGTDHGRYDAIVLADGALAYSPAPGTWASALSADEWSTLADYEREFGVRELDAYAFPQPAYGLVSPADGGDMGGVTGQLTAAGLTVFPELAGPLPIDRWSWG